MIEKFLEKFLPQITERLNENEEVGKALIEALAVLDNYATINNVQFTDEQVNSMLGIVPEPEPEPNADIPAEIIQAEETAWTWRFKTQEELENEFGTNWRNESNFVTPNMDYLLGKSIKETDASKNLIKKYFSKKVNVGLQINPYEVFGISRKEGNDKEWVIFGNNITNQPLPTAAAWSWRFKTQKELREEFGDSNWRKRWGGNMRDYLFGKSIPETPETIDFIDKVINKDLGIDVDTASLFGISNPNNSSATYFLFDKDNVTDKPLTWNWRFKTMEEFEEDYGDNWESKVGWINPNMNYLIGQKLKETFYTEELISSLEENNSNREKIEVEKLGVELIRKNLKDEWYVSLSMFTNKPLPTAVTPIIQTGWTWRFKTEEEFVKDYGKNWRGTFWTSDNTKDYLFGQPIVESDESRKVIEKNYGGNYFIEQLLGIKAPIGQSDYFGFTPQMEITQDPLPTAAAPKKRGRKPKGTATAWTWRFKTAQEFEQEYGEEWYGGIAGTDVNWGVDMDELNMAFLEGQPIKMSKESEALLNRLFTSDIYFLVNVEKEFGIKNPSLSGAKKFTIIKEMITDKALPTTAAPKKRGRKPKGTATAWSWRFKTEKEFEDYYGRNWSNGNPSWNDNTSSLYNMAFLFGQPITQNTSSQEKIKKLENGVDVQVNVEEVFGIKNPNPKGEKIYSIGLYFLTTEPLPTAAAPVKSEPKKRGRKPKSELPEIDLGGLEDIGDIDIDDIDFDNLVI